MMALGNFTMLMTLDEAFIIWDTGLVHWEGGKVYGLPLEFPTTFGWFCEWLKEQGWKIV